MNEPLTQPHYPCPDAPPNIPLSRSNFNASDKPKVYWADVPEGDYLSHPDAHINDYTFPETWPKRFTPLKPPRCVRLITGGSPFEEYTGREQYRSFAQLVKNVCTKYNLLFQWQMSSDDAVIPGVATINPFTVPYSTDPDTGTLRWDFDYTFFDECLFFGEVLQFSVINVFSTVDDYIITDTEQLSKSMYIDVRDYWNLQYLKHPKAKWIFQKQYNPDAVVTAEPLSVWTGYQNIFFDGLVDVLADGWEIGPTFDFDLDYVESTIRDFWRL